MKNLLTHTHTHTHTHIRQCTCRPYWFQIHHVYRRKKQPVPVDLRDTRDPTSGKTNAKVGNAAWIRAVEKACECTYISLGGGNTIAIKCARYDRLRNFTPRALELLLY